MSNEEIKSFAINQGFNEVKEIGTYKDSKVYLPIFTTNNKIVGYPQYIFVNGKEITLRIDVSMEITKALFSKITEE